jgi:2-oxoglutarate dehydrogenase E1 component
MKPLVVVAPKKLLRYKGACSEIDEFTEGTRWLPLIGDQAKDLVAPDKVRKVIMCSG